MYLNEGLKSLTVALCILTSSGPLFSIFLDNRTQFCVGIEHCVLSLINSSDKHLKQNTQLFLDKLSVKSRSANSPYYLSCRFLITWKRILYLRFCCKHYVMLCYSCAGQHQRNKHEEHIWLQALVSPLFIAIYCMWTPVSFNNNVYDNKCL